MKNNETFEVTKNQLVRMVEKNILLIDDHFVIRKGLATLLHDFYKGLAIFEAHDDVSALALLKQQNIDIIVLDLQMPDTDTIQLIELIRIRFPHIFILIFSMLPESLYGRRALNAGASGYLNKDASIDEVKKAFDLAFARKRYISEQMNEVLSQQGLNQPPDNPFEKLSHREFMIVQLLLSGQSISDISSKLNIKPTTVGTYKARILEKLKVGSILELNNLAAVYARDLRFNI